MLEGGAICCFRYRFSVSISVSRKVSEIEDKDKSDNYCKRHQTNPFVSRYFGVLIISESGVVGNFLSPVLVNIVDN